MRRGCLRLKAWSNLVEDEGTRICFVKNSGWDGYEVEEEAN